MQMESLPLKLLLYKDIAKLRTIFRKSDREDHMIKKKRREKATIFSKGGHDNDHSLIFY